MTKEEGNMELMQTLDDAWNAQDWDTFDRRHTSDVVVRWPARYPDVQDVPGQPRRESSLQGVLRQWRLDVFHRPIYRDDERTDGRPGRRRNPAHRQVLRSRFLHCRQLERARRDCRGESFLRCRWHDEAIGTWHLSKHMPVASTEHYR